MRKMDEGSDDDTIEPLKKPMKSHVHGPQCNHGHEHEETPSSLSYQRTIHPLLLDVYSFSLSGLIVMLTYLSWRYEDSIITFESRARFDENLQKYVNSTDFNSSVLMAECIKYFSTFAYDLLVILYLINPLKQITKDVHTPNQGKSTS